jgi:hypothetical protein
MVAQRGGNDIVVVLEHARDTFIQDHDTFVESAEQVHLPPCIIITIIYQQ